MQLLEVKGGRKAGVGPPLTPPHTMPRGRLWLQIGFLSVLLEPGQPQAFPCWLVGSRCLKRKLFDFS